MSPPSWVDAWGYFGNKPKQQCSAGWDYTFQGDAQKVGYNCMWYSSNVTIPGQQTLPRPDQRPGSVEKRDCEQGDHSEARPPGSAGL